MSLFKTKIRAWLDKCINRYSMVIASNFFEEAASARCQLVPAELFDAFTAFYIT